MSGVRPSYPAPHLKHSFAKRHCNNLKTLYNKHIKGKHMNISLRKANALQNSINDTVKGIDFETIVKINEFQDAEQEIARQATTVKANLTRRDSLTTALYEIRKSVSGANTQVGIDNRLADVAHLEKQIQFYNGLASNKVREDEKVVAGRLDKIKNDKGETSRRSIYGYADTVDTSVFTQADLKEFRGVVNSAKKQKQKLQDEILELNVQTTIVLTAATETILQAEGLL
jgi:hypothetical protein